MCRLKLVALLVVTVSVVSVYCGDLQWHLLPVQVAFDGIGSMPMARIENYRQVKQEAVDFEMKRRKARKSLDRAIIASPQGQDMQDSGTCCDTHQN